MKFDIYIISREDEKERPYVSTTCPTGERQNALVRAGYQIHCAHVWVPSDSDRISPAHVANDQRATTVLR